jgi:iron(III) transport system substrate-binding protein
VKPAAAIAAFAALLLGACSDERPPPAAPAEPVVVYTSHADRNYLPQLFEAYTEATGVAVIVRHAEPDAIVDDLIENAITPPADVLLTPTIRGAFRAAEEGALRPLFSETIEGRVAAPLRDPDGFWVALTYRDPVIAFDTDRFDAADVATVDALADPRFRDQLCLSSSSLSTNRTVIAGLIDKLGVREAEVVVRGWVANLARPVFATEDALWLATANGDCGVSLLSKLGAKWVENSPIAESWLVTPQLPYSDVEAVGIGRHARNPEGARALIEWLLGDAVLQRHAASTAAQPATAGYPGDRNVGFAAARDEEARLLAERARYD